jgi:hypothetical protein
LTMKPTLMRKGFRGLAMEAALVQIQAFV